MSTGSTITFNFVLHAHRPSLQAPPHLVGMLYLSVRGCNCRRLNIPKCAHTSLICGCVTHYSSRKNLAGAGKRGERPLKAGRGEARGVVRPRQQEGPWRGVEKSRGFVPIYEAISISKGLQQPHSIVATEPLRWNTQRHLRDGGGQGEDA